MIIRRADPDGHLVRILVVPKSACMTRMLPQLIWMFCLCFLFGCTNNEPIPIYLEGSIPAEANSTVYLINSKDHQHFDAYYRALDSVTVDSSGYFAFEWAVNDAGFYQIRGRKGFNLLSEIDLYLKPGDSLSVEKEAQNIQFTGPAGPRHQLQVDLDQGQQAIGAARAIVRQRLDTFALTLRAKQSFSDSLLMAFASDSELSDVYRKYLEEDIRYTLAFDISYYQRYHTYYTDGQWGFVFQEQFPKAVQAYYREEPAAFPFNNKYHQYIAAVVLEGYEQSIKEVADSLAWATTLPDQFAWVRDSLQGTEQAIALKDLSYSFATNMLSGKDTFFTVMEAMHEYVNEQNIDPSLAAAFNKQYKDFSGLKPGAPAPSFALPDSSGQLVQLSDLSGKVVYVDIWGTWCGPCIQALPKYRALQEQYADRDDIVFLNIALETNQKDILRWKSFIKEQPFGGIHLVAKDQFFNDELAPYQIKFAPTYMLIDAEGRFLDARAPAPDQIGDQLDAALAGLEL